LDASTPLWLWAVVSAAILAVVVAIRVRPWGRRTSTPSVAWFLAATTSAAILVLTTARVIEVLSGATAIRVGLVFAAGALTGILMGVGLTPRESRST
jgi:anti-sigma-K factor RskA